MNVAETLFYGRTTLRDRGDSPALDAALLLAHVLDVPVHRLFLYPELPVEEAAAAAYFRYIDRRRQGEPVAYLRGVREFMGFPFKVDKRVLVPRPETELVVDTLLTLLKEHEVGWGTQVLDLCCGSGAIGLSAAKIASFIEVTLTDVSGEAVALARENAAMLQIADRVTFLVGDLFAPAIEAGMEGSFHYIVSNPPYIARWELETLPADVRDYEPRLALDGGEDGLSVIKRIAWEAPALLVPGGHLIMEIGSDQGSACLNALESIGLWEGCAISDDLAGRERVVIATRTC